MTTLNSRPFGDEHARGLNMRHWDLTPLQTGEVVAANGHSVTIRTADHTYFLTGHNLTYTVTGGDMHLSGGTISSLTVTPYPPAPTAATLVPLFDFQIADFSLDVAALNGFIAGNDAAGLGSAVFATNDHLNGGASKDMFRGWDGIDHLTGGGGHDHLVGGKGRDVLDGGDGNDTLNGGRGHDLLIGGAGADTLDGGLGPDRFVFRHASDSTGNAIDTLRDFSAAHDKIVVPHAVTGIDAGVDAGTAGSGGADSALSSALDGAHLAANHAVIATVDVPTATGPDALLHQTYLVVDVNGIAGYQSGEDLVLLIQSPLDFAGLTTGSFLSPTVTG